MSLLCRSVMCLQNRSKKCSQPSIWSSFFLKHDYYHLADIFYVMLDTCWSVVFKILWIKIMIGFFRNWDACLSQRVNSNKVNDQVLLILWARHAQMIQKMRRKQTKRVEYGLPVCAAILNIGDTKLWKNNHFCAYPQHTFDSWKQCQWVS